MCHKAGLSGRRQGPAKSARTREVDGPNMGVVLHAVTALDVQDECSSLCEPRSSQCSSVMRRNLAKTSLRIVSAFQRRKEGRCGVTTAYITKHGRAALHVHRCILTQRFEPEHDRQRVASRHNSSQHGSSRQQFHQYHRH